MFEEKHPSVELKTLFPLPALGFKDTLANPAAFKTGHMLQNQLLALLSFRLRSRNLAGRVCGGNVEPNKAKGGGERVGGMGRCEATVCSPGQSVMWLDLPSVSQQLLTYTAVSPHISLGQMAAMAPLSSSSTTPTHPPS